MGVVWSNRRATLHHAIGTRDAILGLPPKEQVVSSSKNREPLMSREAKDDSEEAQCRIEGLPAKGDDLRRNGI